MTRWTQGSYEIDTSRARLDVEVVRAFLAGSYWAEGIPIEVVEAACDGSLCFGLYQMPADGNTGAQVGFARVVTDLATFGYLADVFVLEPHRGQGLSKWLVTCVLEDPRLQGFRRWMLATRDAHGLYERFGFRALASPGKFMEMAHPEIYLK